MADEAEPAAGQVATDGGPRAAGHRSWVTSEDGRLQMITFAVTLAANLVTVLVIGGALALVRAFRVTASYGIDGHPASQQPLYNLLLVTVVVAVVCGVLAYRARVWSRREPDDRSRWWVYVIALICFAVLLLVLLLAVLGEAAGIK